MTDENAQNPSMPNEEPFDEGEIQAAEAELSQMKGVDLLRLRRRLKQYEENASMPEAGGIAFTRLYGANGGEINITARSLTPTQAVVDLLESVRYVMTWQKHMDWKPAKGKAPQDTYPTIPAESPAPIVQLKTQPQSNVTFSAPPMAQQASYVPDQIVAGTQSFPAEELVATTSQGRTYWKVKGGKYAKWGVTVWPEVLAQAGIDVGQINTQMPFPLVGFTAHYTMKDDGNPAKVVALTR